MIELVENVPELIDSERMSAREAARFVLVDPSSRRELAFVRACHTVEGWVEYYRTVDCMPDDPLCIRYDGKPLCRRFVEYVRDDQGVLRCPTYRKFRDFDVVERGTGALLKQVRPNLR